MAITPKKSAQKPEAATEQVVVEQAVAEVVEAAPATMVKVLNTCKSFLQQPATGIRIGAGGVAEVKADSWVELQVASGLLKRVK